MLKDIIRKHRCYLTGCMLFPLTILRLSPLDNVKTPKQKLAYMALRNLSGSSSMSLLLLLYRHSERSTAKQFCLSP